MDIGTEAAQSVTLMSPLLGFIPVLPLIGAVLISQLMKKDPHDQAPAGWLATLFALTSFAVTGKLFFDVVSNPGVAIGLKAWTWFSTPSLSAEFALKMDRLSGLMTMIVTGVGSLIHLYAIGYMDHDKARARFFCYLNLFLFAMLLLVLGDNLLVMFVGWEGVGLCSYLLIGFWYTEMPNAQAGQKAFVVNRIGDAGFLLGIFMLFSYCHSFNFADIQLAIAHSAMPVNAIELTALLLFIGAVGKSAQFPLYVWLPDAMAGPTPVSALIHAATMVTAGVYMITRMSFLYVLAPHVLFVISVVGTFTALLAATIALAQTDIKKVLAYSTVSQLGYMFMALGAGAFSNGIFHVVTHAFFKACLFMGAGSVIIGCHHEQDMRHFGGLRKYMPFTFATYFVATLAIAGFPFLAGFYSKDAILWTVYSNPGLPSQQIIFGDVTWSHFMWGCGAFTAFLTAFYMTRSLALTFFGEYRGHEHPHESPWVVTLPLVVLAALSAGFGYFDGGRLVEFLGQWTRPDMLEHEALEHQPMFETLEHLSMGIAVSGIALALVMYLVLPALLKSLVTGTALVRKLHQALLNKWWVDEIYQAVIVRPLAVFAEVLFLVIDRALIDSFFVSGSGMAVEVSQDVVRRAHTGRLGFYALLMFTSSIFFIVFWLLL
ncbi:MAG: NADH-quinone oxidoreductase subunit L [Bdellovibrionota bacterium]